MENLFAIHVRNAVAYDQTLTARPCPFKYTNPLLDVISSDFVELFVVEYCVVKQFENIAIKEQTFYE